MDEHLSFFEGTGRGVAGKITNVTHLRDLCVEDARYFCRALKADEGGSGGAGWVFWHLM